MTQKTSGKKVKPIRKQTWDSVKRDINIAYENWVKKQILPKD